MKKVRDIFFLPLLLLSFVVAVSAGEEKEKGWSKGSCSVQKLTLKGEAARSTTITERTFFKESSGDAWVPFLGFMPVEWTVKNDGDESRRLHFCVRESFDSLAGGKVRSYYDRQLGSRSVQSSMAEGDWGRRTFKPLASFTCEWELEVPSRTEKTLLAYVPLNELQSGITGKRSLVYFIREGGTGSLLGYRVLGGGGNGGWGRNVGAMESLYYPDIVEKGDKFGFRLFLCDPLKAPADKKFYSSLDGFLMTMRDWERMSAAHCRALLEWVSSGGLLFVSDFQEGQGLRVGNYGMGRIFKSVTGAGEKDMRLVYALVNYGVGTCYRENAYAQELNPDEKDYVLRLGWGTPVYILFFVLVVGVVGFVCFSSQGRRKHLLWAVPLSVVAGVAGYAVYLVCANGMSGEGKRFALVQLCPDFGSAHVFQAQISRSGFLWDGSFSLDDDVSIRAAAVSIESKKWDKKRGGILPYGLNKPEWARINTLSRENGLVKGAFVSHKVLFHQLSTGIPWKEQVFLEGREEGSPVVSSDIPTMLIRFEYRDENGQKWGTDSLAPGEKKKLAAIPETEEERKKTGVGARRGDNGKLWKLDSECFRAEAEACPEVPLSTLPSIRWKDRIMFRGKVHKR